MVSPGHAQGKPGRGSRSSRRDIDPSACIECKPSVPLGPRCFFSACTGQAREGRQVQSRREPSACIECKPSVPLGPRCFSAHAQDKPGRAGKSSRGESPVPALSLSKMLTPEQAAAEDRLREELEIRKAQLAVSAFWLAYRLGSMMVFGCACDSACSQAQLFDGVWLRV